MRTMSALLATQFIMAAPAVVFAQTITTPDELNRAAKACGESAICAFEVLHSATPVSDEIAAWTRGAFYYDYLNLAVLAHLESQGADALEILDRAIAEVDRLIAGTDNNNGTAAILHLFRAEHCRDAGQTSCFLQSAEFLLRREIRMRKSFLADARLRMTYEEMEQWDPFDLSEPAAFRWSQIKSMHFDKWAFPYFEDEAARTLDGRDPKGNDYRTRIDSVLVAAEETNQ